MSTIAVTGGSGKLGVWVVEELQRQGYKVVSLDEKRSDRLSCRQVKVDMSNLGHVASAMQGAEGVVHLAAIPAPIIYTHDYIFDNNVMATYNVLEAASMLGIRKAVIGSSESAYGFAWTPKPFAPDYFPIDEEHRTLPHECYGLSKVVGEQTGAMYHRRTGMQVMALRYSTIYAPNDYAGLNLQEPGRYKHTMWSYIDIRDAATATLAALRSDAGGYHALNITSDDTLSDWPSEKLAEQFYPETAERRSALEGRQAVVSNARAKEVLGWEPQYRWEQFKNAL
ncbi:NAD-dependent epimerase/dehydratase family protein [Cohnella sp. GCM10027633]|uniref:NAD-dependent epimerase/dehydratase family protein n=1 Tax=unclassified Cohnella TaxID=2636738 RepID=UPI003644A9A1